jgi:hypothetical protein
MGGMKLISLWKSCFGGVKEIFGSSLAAATFLAVGDGEDAAPGTWGSWEG